MSTVPGFAFGVSFSVEDLTSTQGLLILGLAGLVVVLWLVGVLLVRGSAAKAVARQAERASAPLGEIKDLVDGLHENLSKLSDAMELFRDKSENRIGTMSRALESLPRVNEGVAKIREALPAFEKILKEAAGASASGYDQKLKDDLQKALGDLKVKEQENTALRKDLEKFHETMQAQALEMERGNEKGLKEKFEAFEKERKTLEDQKAAFARHQEMIKTQIKEAGDKLRRMQDEVRKEKEEVAKLKARGPEAAALQEQKAKLEREWEMLQQQQQMLKGERDWLEAEKFALNEEKKNLENARKASPKTAAAASPVAAAPVPAPADRPPVRSAGETQEMVMGPEAAPPSRLRSPAGAPQNPETLKAWGYSSLAEETPPAPVAEEEEITPATPEEPAPPEAPPAPGPEGAPSGAPAGTGEGSGWENILSGPRRSGVTALKGVVPAEDLPGLPPREPEAPASRGPAESTPSPAEPAPLPAAVAAEAPVASEGDIPFQDREQGWSAALWNGIFILRLEREELKNEEAHALDAIVFNETEAKEDRILLDLERAKYVNSRGLSSLTKIAVQRTAHLALANDNVVKVMDMMGFLPLFTIFPTRDAALAGFANPS
ncbi:MAG: hypothetical protein MUC63_05660 [Planctomycetes bacterium]|nr:hypothetical protein [Planctomycetota bacterium]